MDATLDVPEPLFADAVRVRRNLHRHPELGFRETRTAEIVATSLRAAGIEVFTEIAVTGVVGVLAGTKPGRTVMLRADMDALPMPEEKDVAYRSIVPNVMHGCGHDGHVATLLAAATWLGERRDDLAGTIVFVFQPAEEGLGGGRRMVEEGLIERFAIERAYGLHYSSMLPVGTFGTRPGPLMASADSFEVTITGAGGHGAMPHRSIDPIAAAGQTIVGLQQIVARRVDPLAPAVVSVCSVHAGTTYNVIPTHAELKGTIRAFDEDVRAHLIAQVGEVCGHACATSGARAHVRFVEGGFPVTINDGDQARYVRTLAATTLGAERACEMAPVMGAEDFSYYAQRVPACFFFVGSNGDAATAHPNHHGKFDLDERAIRTGIALMRALALDAPRNAP